MFYTASQFHSIKESLVGKKFQVLSKGYVTLVDALGGDVRIVEAARTTSQIGSSSSDNDANLIRYLLRHRHGTPFEFPHVCLKVVAPMDCWRQWIRHRMANVNEYSTRYSVVEDNYDVTDPTAWRVQSKSNRQGSDDKHLGEDGSENEEALNWRKSMEESVESGNGRHRTIGEHLSDVEESLHKTADAVYRERLKFGVAREQARKDLPLSTYTEAYWQSDLRNLLNFLSLRMEKHAQLEIRKYAETIGHEIVAKLFPVTWKAFLDYDFNGMHLTSLDQEALKKMASLKLPMKVQEVPDDVWPESWRGLNKCREKDECIAKLICIGLLEE